MNISHNNIRKYKAKALSSKNSFTTFCFRVVFLVHVFHWPGCSLANFLLILQHLTAFVVKTSLVFILFLSAPSFCCLSLGSGAKAVTCKHVWRKCDQVIFGSFWHPPQLILSQGWIKKCTSCFHFLLFICISSFIVQLFQTHFAGQFGNLHLLCVITRKRRSSSVEEMNLNYSWLLSGPQEFLCNFWPPVGPRGPLVWEACWPVTACYFQHWQS